MDKKGKERGNKKKKRKEEVREEEYVRLVRISLLQTLTLETTTKFPNKFT
jgi:hypothetical protein